MSFILVPQVGECFHLLEQLDFLLFIFITGFPPYLENLENLEFFHFLFQTLKMPQKVVKTWNFNSKPWKKNLKLANSMFQALLFKMSFTKIILIYFVISILSTQTRIRRQIDLWFHCFFLEITWKIYGILCHKRSGNLALTVIEILTHFEIFIIKICMKVPGILHQKPWKNLEFRTKGLRKPGICYLEKKWEPCISNTSCPL